MIERGEAAGPPMNLIFRVGVALVWPIVRALFRFRILEVERIPASGAAILAANHVSVLDGPILCLPAGHERRRVVRFLVAAELFRSPLFGPIMRAGEQIAIRRGQGDAGALDEAIRAVRGGELVGIFPEGRVGRSNLGELQRIRTGAARIALATGAPLIPVGIWGTNRRWPRGGVRLGPPLRPPLTITIGGPIHPEGDSEDPRDVQELTDRLEAAMSSQMNRARNDADGGERLSRPR